MAQGGGAAGYAAVPEEELRSGLTFQEFFGVMVEDEHRLEKGGEEELARAIFGMVDAVVCVGDDDEAADAADVDESAPPPRARPSTTARPRDRRPRPALFTKGADHPSTGGGDRKAEMLSREELKSCFDGVPGFPAHSVDDFVFLFSLNGDGQIDFHAFLAVCKELTILRHAS